MKGNTQLPLLLRIYLIIAPLLSSDDSLFLPHFLSPLYLSLSATLCHSFLFLSLTLSPFLSSKLTLTILLPSIFSNSLSLCSHPLSLPLPLTPLTSFHSLSFLSMSVSLTLSSLPPLAHTKTDAREFLGRNIW